MIFSFQAGNHRYEIDFENPIDISIPLCFDGEQPNAYAVEKATARACEAGDLIGDTRRGGSCNFEQIKFIPHCNGTHTESVGHITDARISVRDCLRDVFIFATLISVVPEKASAANETYTVELNENDLLITRSAIENGLNNSKFQVPNSKSDKMNENFPKGLIVRALPNDAGKLTRTYLEKIPPFFSIEAMHFLSELKIKHLLVDLPSIDRIFDEGNLSNHRIFWNVAPKEFKLNERSLIHSTITELIYAPDEIIDGNYLLNLQIAPFASDASPSRPILFKISAA